MCTGKLKVLDDREIRRLAEELQQSDRFAVAIDGRCTAGKTTLAGRLAELTGADVLQMDDFFLRPEQRTAERYAEPGGNVDRERVYEVLKAWKEEGAGSFRRFDCGVLELGEEKGISGQRIIVEGSYSMHPVLREFYDLTIFLTVSPEGQMRRIAKRDPEKVQAFREKWIPLEERYFEAMNIQDVCMRVYTTE
ncbi:MAG: hypothetical protein IKF51_08150 [Solobacterium sp.]|nr:hypothetical protein [Solobacterium sp.]